MSFQLVVFCSQACAQVSLADYHPRVASLKWYNLLNFKFLQPSSTKSNAPGGSTATSSTLVHNNKEESSDDSTIISSQTSTLTRNQGLKRSSRSRDSCDYREISCSDENAFFFVDCEHNTLGPINDQLNEFNYSDDDDDDFNEDTDVEEEPDDEESDEDVDVFYYPDDEPLEQVLEISVCSPDYFSFAVDNSS